MVKNRFCEGLETADKALRFFAKQNQNMLVADHYRDEFVSLIQNPRILGMAWDLCTLQYPDLDELMLRLNKRAHDLQIPTRSLGGVTNALKFLCQDFYVDLD